MPDPELISFYIIASAIIVGAMGIIFSKQLLSSALYLLMTLLAIAAIFITLGAEFLGVAQILVYIGGILILILFGIIVTHQKGTVKTPLMPLLPGLGLIGIFLYNMVRLVFHFDFPETTSPGQSSMTNSENLGVELMSTYIIPFEVMAIILLMVLMGAVVLVASKKSVK